MCIKAINVWLKGFILNMFNIDIPLLRGLKLLLEKYRKLWNLSWNIGAMERMSIITANNNAAIILTFSLASNEFTMDTIRC